MIQADIHELVRQAKFCVKPEDRHEACMRLGAELIDAHQTIDKLRRAVEMYELSRNLGGNGPRTIGCQGLVI